MSKHNSSSAVLKKFFFLKTTEFTVFSAMSDRGYSGTGDRADLNNYSNQLNPTHSEYRGGTTSYTGAGTTADLSNHSNQMNPNNSRSSGGKK